MLRIHEIFAHERANTIYDQQTNFGVFFTGYQFDFITTHVTCTKMKQMTIHCYDLSIFSFLRGVKCCIKNQLTHPSGSKERNISSHIIKTEENEKKIIIGNI